MWISCTKCIIGGVVSERVHFTSGNESFDKQIGFSFCSSYSAENDGCYAMCSIFSQKLKGKKIKLQFYM